MFSQSRPLEFCPFLNLSNFTLNTPEPLIDVCCCFKFLQAPFLIWVYAPIHEKSFCMSSFVWTTCSPPHAHLDFVKSPMFFLVRYVGFSEKSRSKGQEHLAPHHRTKVGWLVVSKKCGTPPKFNMEPEISKGAPSFRFQCYNVCFARGVITKVIIFSIDLNGILCGSQFE